MEWLVWSIVGAVVCGAIATAKRRNVFGWIVLGALFCVVSIIILLCLPKLDDGYKPRQEQNHDRSNQSYSYNSEQNYNNTSQEPQVLYEGKEWTVTTRELIKKFRDGSTQQQININSITSIEIHKYLSESSTFRTIMFLIFIGMGLYIFIYSTFFMERGSVAEFWYGIIFCWICFVIGYAIFRSGQYRKKKLRLLSKGEEIVLMDFVAGYDRDEQESNRIYQEVIRLLRY